MKRVYCALLLLLSMIAVPLSALAQPEEPTIYIIKKGDTLWGLSDRFLKDPFYWPDLWSRNQRITNPHLVYPGQRLRVFSDRIELEEAPGSKTAKTQANGPLAEVAADRTYLVTGGEGFLLEKELQPSGEIIATKHDKIMVGKEDLVYTNIGTDSGAKPGSTFSIFQKLNKVKHPVTNEFLGWRVASLGALKLTELTGKNSSAMIIKSYREINTHSYLMPYRERKREVALKSASRDLHGYIVETKGNIVAEQRDNNVSIGKGDIAYLDLGKSHGLKIGNVLYVTRDVHPEKYNAKSSAGTLPKMVIGALVVVETGDKTSTGLLIKSSEDIIKGDRVELIKN
jgi:hypothetical protein